MPTAPPPIFGRIDKPETINFEPFDFRIAGYRETEDGGRIEEVHTFTASGIRPFYTQVEVTKAAAANNNTLAGATLADQLEKCLINDEERERWRQTLGAPDVYFDAGMLLEVIVWVTEQYADRPTQPRSDSHSSPRRAGRSSRGAGSGTVLETSAVPRRG
jgi:hypothetical protein